MSEDQVRVQQSTTATRGVAADVELSTEPARVYATQVSPNTYLNQVVVQATAADGGDFEEPRLALAGINRLTRADWEALDRAARRLFDEYDRVFDKEGDHPVMRLPGNSVDLHLEPGEPAPDQAIAPRCEDPLVTVKLAGVLLVREENVSARQLRPAMDRLLERVGAQKVSVVVTSLEPL
jgi:hypothetical protein